MRMKMSAKTHVKHPVPLITAVFTNSLTSFNTENVRPKTKYTKYTNKCQKILNSVKNMAKTDNTMEVQTVKKNSNKQQGSKEKQKPPTKIVIRHLPPTMKEEEFLKQIDPLPAHDFYYFAAADWSLGFDATCRAYITLKNYEDVFLFRDRFDGYVFVDAKGQEYGAIVEFAPFQGLLKNKSRRTDNKVNTIETEAHYQQFLTKLSEEREAAVKGGECKLEFNLNTKKEEITSTPLLQYLANKKEKRRLEAKKRTEEKRRQREEEKEKRRSTTQDKSKSQQVPRIVSSSSSTTKQEQNETSKESTGAADTFEEKQSARARKRNERSQRRQEAYLLRKKNERSGKEGDQTKDGQVNKEAKKEERETVQKVEKQIEGVEQINQTDLSDKPIDKKRERHRERNKQRRDRERERQKNKETVRSEVKYEQKVKVEAIQNNFTAVEIKKQSNEDYLQSKSEEELKQQRAAEERRIRNKDRPSMAIYQPKPRVRHSEDSDNGGNSAGGGRQSDGEKSVEAVKVSDVQRPKKVSRYSERRNERRAVAKEKRRSSATDEEVLTQSKDLEVAEVQNN